jgi:catechol 2,3-dioxygenase-like lactoylglutathione lyase family enzyme
MSRAGAGSRMRMTLKDSKVAARLPARDLDRAREWYAEKLGLEPSDQRPGGLLYRMDGGDFALFASQGAASGEHTQMAFEVEDVEAVVAELRSRGVVFEEYEGLTHGGIAEIEGNYPSKHSTGERAAWFRDCEGNMLGVGELVR